MHGSGLRQHQRQQRVNGHRGGGSRDVGRDILGAAQSGADYDEDWDDDVYYAPAARPREGNEDTIGAKGNTQAMERQNSDGSMVELRVGADTGGLGGAAKSGGRDRTPTKGHYMKVPNMRHMRALRPSNLEVLDSFATDILHANNSSSSSNSSGDQGQSSRVPPSSLEKNVSPESAACSGDGSSSSLRFVLGPAMPPSAEPSPPQKMQDDAGACDDSLPAEAARNPPVSPSAHGSAASPQTSDRESPRETESTLTGYSSLVSLRSSSQAGGPGRLGRTAGSPASASPFKAERFPKIGGQANKQKRQGPPSAAPSKHGESALDSVLSRPESDDRGGGRTGDGTGGINANSRGKSVGRDSVCGARSGVPGKRRRAHDSPGQRSGPGAWPKLPGEHSTPPKQPPFRRHPVSEQEHDDYMTHAAGSGQDRIGGKSSNTQHRHGHEIDEGRQKRRRADPAPAIARPRVNGVEHNCSQNDGVQESQRQYQHQSQHQQQGEQPSKSGSSSPSPSTQNGTASNRSSPATPGRSKSPAATNVAPRQRGMHGDRAHHGNSSRQNGVASPGDASRGPSLTDRPARWGGKGISSSLRSPVHQRVRNNSVNAVKMSASSSRGSTVSRTPLSAGGARGSGGKDAAGRYIGPRARSKGVERGRHDEAQVRTFKLSSVFQSSSNSSFRPRGTGSRERWNRSPHAGNVGANASLPGSSSTPIRIPDPTRFSGLAAAETEDIEEAASDGGNDGGGGVMRISNDDGPQDFDDADWPAAGGDHSNVGSWQQQHQARDMDTRRPEWHVGSDGRPTAPEHPRYFSADEGPHNRRARGSPDDSSRDMGNMKTRDGSGTMNAVISGDVYRGERSERMEIVGDDLQSKAAGENRDRTTIQLGQQPSGGIGRLQAQQQLQEGRDEQQALRAADQAHPAKAPIAPPVLDAASPGQKQQQHDPQKSHARPLSPPPRTPVRPRSFSSSGFSRGPPHTATSTPAASGGSMKGKGSWRPSFGSGDSGGGDGGMPAPWGAAAAFSTPSRSGAASSEATQSMGSWFGTTGSASARRRKGGGAGSGPMGKLLQKVRGRFDSGEAKLLSGEFPFRQHLASAASFDTGNDSLGAGGRLPISASSSVGSRRDHGDPRTRCSIALDITVLPCATSKADDLAVGGAGVGQAGGVASGLVRLSCFVHAVLDVRGEGLGVQRVDGELGIGFHRLLALEGGLAGVVFKMDTRRALDIGPGSQLRMYDPCCVWREGDGSVGGVGDEAEGVLLTCTQLCEPFPACLPPLRAVQAAEKGVTMIE